jgi:uncharacterized protein YjbJ (UPF0337 family)
MHDSPVKAEPQGGRHGTQPRKRTVMNKDQATGTWNLIRGMAKRISGELTDDDFLKAGGSIDKLFGTMERCFGDTKEQIKAKIDHLHIK